MQRKVQIFIAVVVLALAGVAIYTSNQAKRKEAEIKTLKESLEKNSVAAEENKTLDDARAEEEARRLEANAAAEKNSSASNADAASAANVATAKTNDKSTLASLTEDPQMRKALRDQQKMGMGMLYGALAKKLKLSKEDTEKLNDFLADNIMDNVDQITKLLREGKSDEEMRDAFAAQDAGLNEKLKAMLGEENFAQYQDYSRNLGSRLTTDQFKGMFTGDKKLKEEQTKQLYETMQEETRYALTSTGLDPNFQTIPMLNFRNIASEQESEKNIKLLDDIYDRVALRAGNFLSADELSKFLEYRTNAINMSRMAILMNRKMMAPGGQ